MRGLSGGCQGKGKDRQRAGNLGLPGLFDDSLVEGSRREEDGGELSMRSRAMRRGFSVRLPWLVPVATAAVLGAGSGVSGLGPATAAPGAPAAPVAPALAAELAKRADYRCRGRFDAVDVTAFFFSRSPAEVVLLEGETATRLPQQLAADGARYAAADQSFWIKGDQARWQRGQLPPLPCGPRGL